MQALLDAIVDLVALVSPTKVGAVAAALRGISNPAGVPNVFRANCTFRPAPT